MVVRRSPVSGIAVLAAAVLAASLAHAAEPPRGGPCRWAVVATRAAGPRDVPFDAGNRALAEPIDWNHARGPGALWAMVRNDAAHHGHIFLDDSAAGTSHTLLARWACMPAWSPDGRWIACNTWVSRERPYVLVLVELASGRTWEPPLTGQVGEYRWSPDSKYVAADVVGGAWELGALVLVDPAKRTFAPLDSAVVFGDYEYAWAPDSRTLAVVKPSRMDVSYTDEVSDSDLWLMGVDLTRCKVLPGHGARFGEPRWMDARHVLYTREVWGPESTSPPKRRVLTLAPAK